tara:strand:- start:470 stop:781 length:312 start_codon:yes stop_codon:yes gene_type:complete
MDIENCNVPFNICMPCHDSNDEMNDLCDSMNECSVDNSQITIYIATILEKFIKEMKYQKKYDNEAELYYLDINPPPWFYGIEKKYQKILIKLIEPVLQEYIKN